jgi:hypothetical protein
MMNTGQMIMFRDDKFGYHRFWEILSICYGAVGQEDLIEIRAINFKPGRDTEGREHRTMWVPAALLRKMEIYERLQVAS